MSWVLGDVEVVVVDWPVVTGGLRHNNKLKQGLTGTHFQTCVCRQTYKVGILASTYMVFVFVFAVFVILALVA